MMGGGFGFGIPGVGMWIFWILLIVLVFWVVRGLPTRETPRTRDRSALEILEERYARGEIDKAEFDSKRRDLLG